MRSLIVPSTLVRVRGLLTRSVPLESEPGGTELAAEALHVSAHRVTGQPCKAGIFLLMLCDRAKLAQPVGDRVGSSPGQRDPKGRVLSFAKYVLQGENAHPTCGC